MRILALDTSTPVLSLAVADSGKIVRARNRKVFKAMSDSILPDMEKILEAAGAGLTSIDAFVVGLGPGSFTGLRVGLATAKGLAFALGKPVAGVCSLDALAFEALEQPVPLICVLQDARRGMVYACLYRSQGSCVERVSEYLLCEMKDVLKLCRTKTFFCGDAVALYGDMIKKALGPRAVLDQGKHIRPQAKCLAILGLERLAKKKKGDNLNTLAPMYLYPAACQVRKG